MFRDVALGKIGDNCTSDDGSISKAKVTRRKYLRLSEMVRAGLIIRKKRKYSLSSLGKIIYHNQEIIQSALNDYWKLRAIDSVEIFGGPPKEDHQQLIKSLINDHTLKEILTKKYYSDSVKNENNNMLIQNSQCTSICKQKEKANFSIMLIEDEPDTLLTYKTILSDEAYNVDAFVDSYEAFKHFINLNGPYYDLVVIDIRMPGLNGLQLYRRLRMIDDKLNAIFISALDAVQELASIFPELNQNNFIKKPATKEEFLNKVKAAVSQMYVTPNPLVRQSSN